MTVLTHAVPDDLIAGLRTGDDQLIERGFHELFPGLLADADAALHDQASASRVVERAFGRLLAVPPGADPTAVRGALEHEMHQAIVREQSRLAALRRFEHNEHVDHSGQHHTEASTAQVAWSHILDARTRAAQPHVAPDAKEAQHLAAEHMSAAMGDRNRWSIPLIIGAVIVLGAGGYALMRVDGRPSDQFITAQLNSSTARTISSSAGRTGNVSLADETAIRIGAGSSVKVVNNYGEKLRAISVQGAVSLAIASQRLPLEIRAKGVALSAADGKLDVRSDDGRPTIVRVVAGAPRITVGDSIWVAAAGQSYAIDGIKLRSATAAEIDESFGWLDGRFVVNGTVREVVAGFRRWYDVDVGIADGSIADSPAQVSASLDSFSSALGALQQSAKVRMIWQDRHMLLFRK
jgi:ferric-dicitrate binding protein FerR (iron transport regulator)